MAAKVRTIAELREELKGRREAVHKFWQQAASGGADTIDLALVTEVPGTTEEKAAWFQAQQKELDELQIELDGQLEMQKVAEENEREYKRLTDPASQARHAGGAREGKSDDGWSGQSLGRMFTDSPAFKEYSRVSHKSPAVEIPIPEEHFERILKGGQSWDLKALLDTATGFAPESTRTGLILPGPLRRPVVADLIPQGTTAMNAIVFMEETTTTNGAAAVAEGAAKPESALVFTEQTSAVKKLATVLPVTDELLEDEPAMRSYVEQRLRTFLALTEETQLISGSGAGANLRGMLNVVGIQTQAKGTDPTPDAVYKAITLIATNAFLDASGAIFHPNDWQDVRLLKTADGIYIWGAPMDPGPDRIWGLPVIKTVGMTENTAIVAAFDTAMQIFRRTEVAFAVSDQHSDFFTTNKLMLRVEERLAFPVYRPAGICTVTGI